MSTTLTQQIIRFGCTGLVGFVVDGGLLALLIHGGGDAYLSRIVSFLVAVGCTFAINRAWTFGHRGRDGRARQFWLYLGGQTQGALTNFAVYATMIGLFGSTLIVAMEGFALGSAAGLIVNFTGARLIVFAKRSGEG